MDSVQILTKLKQHHPIASEFIDALYKSDLTAWLVGGCIRDVLLGRQCADIDVVSVEDPSDWARSWAKRRGHWFWLDEQRRHSRIVLPHGLCFDFSPLRAATIEGDLAARDFTINALAVQIRDAGTLVDPLHGISDLHNCCLKMCSDATFSDDPLRLLKGARHAAVLNFRFDENSLAAMVECTYLIHKVAPERIRDELFLIFSVRDLVYSLGILFQTGMLNELFGSSDATWSPLGHGQLHQKIYERFDDISQGYRLPVADKLLKQSYLFLYAAFLMAYAPERYQLNCKKLRLSREQQRILLALQGEVTDEWIKRLNLLTTERQLALAVEQLNPCGPQRLFYWGWCQKKIPEGQLIETLSAYWTLEQNDRISNLLDGHQIAQFVEDQQVGLWLSRIKLEEIKGQIRSPEDAMNWMRAQLSIDKN